MIIASKNPKRIGQLLWSKNFRERTQHLSVAPRPQYVRTAWIKDPKNKEMKANPKKSV